MATLGTWWVGLPIWRPVAGAMRQLRLPMKMLLIGAAFALPLLQLLSNELRHGWQSLQVVQAERDGIRLARATYAALQQAGQWRFMARSQAFGDAGADPVAARQAYLAAHAALQALQVELGGQLGTGPAWQQVAQALTAAQALPPASAPQAVVDTLNPLARSLVALLDSVTDGAGLSLDPEGPSYHLMSAALLQAPTIIQSTAELRGLGGPALQTGELPAATALQMVQRTAVIRHALHSAEQSLAKAVALAPGLAVALRTEGGPRATHDALARLQALFGLDAATGPALQPGVAGDAAGELGAAGRRQAFVQAMNQSLAAQFGQVQHNLGVLDGLLVARAASLRTAWP